MLKINHSFFLFFFFFFNFAIFFANPTLYASDENSIQLTLPSEFSLNTCSVRPWIGKTAKWGGVTDERTEKAVGQQSKSGEILSQVNVNPPLEQVFDISLKQLFTSCGIQWTNDDQAPEIHIAITEFFAGSDKKLFTGKGQAQSRLRLEIGRQHMTLHTLEVGFSIENKGLRKAKLKQLQSTLNELLAETLRQIPKLNQLGQAL